MSDEFFYRIIGQQGERTHAGRENTEHVDYAGQSSAQTLLVVGQRISRARDSKL